MNRLISYIYRILRLVMDLVLRLVLDLVPRLVLELVLRLPGLALRPASENL